MQGRLIEISKAIYKEFCEWLEEGETQGESQEDQQPAQLQEQRN